MASLSLKLYNKLTSSFINLHNKRISINNNSFSLHSFRFFNSTSANLLEDADTSISSSSAAHSWPEWDQFVDKIKSKGFFEKTQEVGFDSTSALDSLELNRVKHACMEFARERYDIIRFLPKDDIKNIVECGCPNLMRKVVHSAKRLRSFLKLDEAEVCGACKLRGSCDLAYIIEKEDAKARTVDLMRILMIYAVDPTLNSSEANPSITEHFQMSARKLLGELIKLSDTTMNPMLPKPETCAPSKKESSEESQKVVSSVRESRNVEMKRGDWLCPGCNFLNFARNLRCLECKADGPSRVDFSKQEMKLGDWTCPKYLSFSFKCEFMNFARNRKCFRCLEMRPKRELNPGEWECSKCFYINFKRNTVCKRCDSEKSAYGAQNSRMR